MLGGPVLTCGPDLLVVEAAAAATPPEAVAAGTRVRGKSWIIPVGLEAGKVPVGLVGVGVPVGLRGEVTVRLPVGAAAVAVVAALSLTISPVKAILAPGQQVRRGVEGALPGLEIVTEIRVRKRPV